MIGVTIAAPWVATRAIVHAATARGWTVRTEGGRIGLRGIWFKTIELGVQREATLHADFGPTCVFWSSVFGRRKLVAGSGSVQLTGTLDELRSLLSDNQDRHRSRSVGASSTDFEIHNTSVAWRKSAAEEASLAIRELTVTRHGARLAARIGVVSARHGTASVELAAAVIEPDDARGRDRTADDEGERTSPFRVSVGEVLAKYDSAAVPARVGEPSTVSAATGQAPATSARADEPPAMSAPIGEPPKPSNHVASRARPNPGKPSGPANPKREFLPLLSWLIDQIVDVTRKVSDKDADAARWLDRIGMVTRFESPAFRIRILDAGQKLELGPWPVHAERRPQELSLEMSQNASAGRSALSAKVTVADSLEHATVRLAVGPIALPQLGVTEGDFGLENIGATQLEFEGRAEYQSKRGEVSIESKGRIERLSVRQPFLARETVRNIGFSWEGAALLDSAKRQLKSDLLRLTVGSVSARLHGTVELGSDHQVIDGALEVPLAACQDLVDALPEGLAPLLRDWRMDRNFALRLSVAFDSRRPEKSLIGFSLDNHCRVVSVPLAVAPSRFEKPFILEVEDEHGALLPTSFGPGTWGWTPLGAIAPYVESAVLVCEDGRFLSHNGFDREAIQNSIRENLRTLRFSRGASTVSMQLAKNLYLRRDKTIARKIQEAALTMLLEQSFTKRQLLELYLNVIEFGPGLYGIGPAAKHYFDVTPDRLTLAQSFYLISTLPNPKQQHFGPDGLVRPGWMKLVRSLMTIAQRRGHFSVAELEAGLEEQPAFHVPGNSVIAPSRRILQDEGAVFDDELSPPPTPEE
jgi:hypothetical protein